MTELARAVIAGAVESEYLSQNELSFISKGDFAGITLFKRNITDDANQIEKLVATIQANSQTKRIIAVDQEGGRVDRFKNSLVKNHGPALDLAEGLWDENALMQLSTLGKDVGNALKVFGINVNFAPVTDINTNPQNPIIGNRAFGTTPESASSRAGAWLRGLQETGVIGCLKHFPGHGDSEYDTHLETAKISLDENTLRTREMIPFCDLIHEAKMIMVAHCIYESLDQDRPASLSHKIVTKILREQLGYSGLIVTDDLNMKALPQDYQTWGESLVEALMAGNDLLLVCRDIDRWAFGVDFLERSAKASPALAVRLENAATNVMNFRQSLI